MEKNYPNHRTCKYKPQNRKMKKSQRKQERIVIERIDFKRRSSKFEPSKFGAPDL